MFGWLRGKPPLEAREKAWVETRMHRLADQFGIERLLNAKVVLPTDEYFPGASAGEPADRQLVLRRVCEHLHVDPQSVQLEPLDQEPANSPRQGVSCCGNDCSAEASPDDLTTWIAAMSRRLSLILLTRDGGVATAPADRETLADLTPVFFGLGVAAANTATAHGRLPVRMLAYGLALFASIRDETRPSWARHLCLDAAGPFRGGLRYLGRNNDSLFQSGTIRRRYGALSVNELSTQLRSGTPSVKIAALWELADKGPGAAAAVPLVVDCLRVPHPDIRAEAATALGAMGDAAGDSATRLADALHDEHERVRASAASALGRLRPQLASVVPELAAALADDNPAVVREVAWALQQYGADAEPALTHLLQALRTALVQCNDSNAQHLTAAVGAIVPDAEQRILSYFDDHDEDLKHAAIDLFRTPHPE